MEINSLGYLPPATLAAHFRKRAGGLQTENSTTIEILTLDRREADHGGSALRLMSDDVIRIIIY